MMITNDWSDPAPRLFSFPSELAGKRGIRKTDILATVETNHKTWRKNLTEIATLDDDLRALDARSRIVAFRETRRPLRE
jgi:hypothetical protein